MLLGAAGLSLPVPRLYAAPSEGYSGRLLVTLQCDGAWDVTSFCDPKSNQPGEKEITQWSRSDDIQTAGNIQYAPFANNQSFFDNYYQDMLVINGVDMQTNSHTTGVLHNWSGRNTEGYPTITAMFAANNAPEQPLSYLNFGGYSQTANLIRYSRLNGGAGLDFLLDPAYLFGRTPLSTEVNLTNIREFRKNKTQEMMSDATLMNRQKGNLQAYNLALSGQDNLKKFLDYVPDDNELEGGITLANKRFSDLRDQVRFAAAAFQ
ncbi:MAG: hypothetical protein CMP89_14955, partial [Gammaproteobacteria bacterium]|nr:hypothetical protein [Gammaproteobacteria bacterium]